MEASSTREQVMTRLRKNVWTLPAGDQTLDWYGKAVLRMRGRPLMDPLGWRFQAAMHGYPGQARDPLSDPGDPQGAVHDLWEQCQHATSFFPPWHRMYLLHFERGQPPYPP